MVKKKRAKVINRKLREKPTSVRLSLEEKEILDGLVQRWRQLPELQVSDRAKAIRKLILDSHRSTDAVPKSEFSELASKIEQLTLVLQNQGTVIEKLIRNQLNTVGKLVELVERMLKKGKR